MSTPSPNMQLPIPPVGAEAGPQYAFDINTALSLVDAHDHSLGKGVQVSPSGLNINADLSFQSNSATFLKSLVFSVQASPLSVLQAAYVSGVDLWYTDGNGNQVQLTAGGNVNATAASIPGQSYAAGTFTWKQGTGSTTPANFDIGSVTLRPNVAATTFGVTLSPPSAISTAYSIALPALPSQTNIMSMDVSGNMYALINVDNTTLSLTSNVLSVAAGGITTTQISSTANILGSQLSSSANVLGSQLSASAGIVGSQLSSSAGIVYTQLAAPNTWAGTLASQTTYTTGTNAVITITGFTPNVARPIFYALTSTATNGGGITVSSGIAVQFTITSGLATVSSQIIDNRSNTQPLNLPISVLNTMVAGLNVGAVHTAVLNLIVVAGSGSVVVTPITLNVTQI